MGATVHSPDLGAVQAELDAFLASRRSLVLGTQGEDGCVELSVAPFVPFELQAPLPRACASFALSGPWTWMPRGCENRMSGLAVFLSDLAPHTANLRRTGAAEVLLLEDEAEARQPFARTRLSLTCSVGMLDREDAQGRAVLEAMEAAFGGIVPLLRGLPDFHLFLLVPRVGRYVAGFGKAYRLEGLRVVEHLGT